MAQRSFFAVHTVCAVLVGFIASALQPGTLNGAGACATAVTVATCRALGETVEVLPPSPAVIGLARITLPPGSSFPDIVVPGPALLVVLEGIATVHIPGETGDEDDLEETAQQATWRSSEGTPIPSDRRLTIPQVGIFAFELGAGDQIATRPDVPHTILNRGQVSLSLLAVTVTPPEPPSGGPDWPPAGAGALHPPAGVSLVALDVGYQEGLTMPGERARLSLDLVELVAGSAAPVLEQSLGLIAVETGTLMAVCEEPVTARVAAGRPAAKVAAGSVVAVTAGGALVTGDSSQCDWRGADGSTASVLVVLVSTEGDLGTPLAHDH